MVRPLHRAILWWVALPFLFLHQTTCNSGNAFLSYCAGIGSVKNQQALPGKISREPAPLVASALVKTLRMSTICTDGLTSEFYFNNMVLRCIWFCHIMASVLPLCTFLLMVCWAGVVNKDGWCVVTWRVTGLLHSTGVASCLQELSVLCSTL
jgi:hypothetical protein